MDTRQRVYDTYRRKLQRVKVKSVEYPFRFGIAGKRCKFHPFKIILSIIVVFGTLFTILSFPTVPKLSQQHTLKRWIWGGSDPRYISDLDINLEEIKSVLEKLPKDDRIRGVSLLNFNKHEIRQWKHHLIPTANHTVLHLDSVEKNVTWDSLYPEWIDEEQEEEVPTCPSLPKLNVPRQPLDLIAVKLPCKKNEGNWSRDIARFHLQISAAGLAASYKGNYPVHLLFVSSCFPLPNLFVCKDIVARKGNTWLYKPNLNALREKLQLPIGSCELSLPIGGATTARDYSKRVAYATILHSADVYVCGAIAAAQSIRMAGSKTDLIILVDETISEYHKSGLKLAGWKVRTIQRIRNPKAEKNAYNEWNYSKFRLWQLTDYDKIIFIDSDMLILRNIDFLFNMPEISATGNNGTLFNSGVMVIEPSNCTFQLLMNHISSIESYNGGDQGYLNEIFTYWHRIPKQMNFLKHFWIGDDLLTKRKKIELFGADPPILYVVHYLGNKPWMCFRDYDCNWNVDILREFASDVAHRKWWKVYDEMPDRLKEFCLLKSLRKAQLEWDRREAEKGNYSDGHWRIEIEDERLNKCVDHPYCNWRGMLDHWGE